MNHTEHSARKPSLASGFHATRCAFRRIQSSGKRFTSSIDEPADLRRCISASLLLVCVVCTAASVFATPALAAAPEAPEVTVQSIRATEATFRGVLNPEAVTPVQAGTYQFIYRSSKTNECQGVNEIQVPASPSMSFGLEHEEVFEAVTGITANTEYAVCLSVTTPGGTTLSAPITFTTALPPEQPQTNAATAVTGSAVKLNGILNPIHAGEPGAYEFVYRKSATECQGEGETVTPIPAAVSRGISPEPVPAEEVTGLLPGTTYTYCLRALNGAGESALGNAVSFTTLAVPPTVSEESVLNVASGSVTLAGQVNPGGVHTTYQFEYGPIPSYGKSVPVIADDLAAGTETVTVSAHPQDLVPGVFYHYRLVAGNEMDKEVAGPDQTFTTQSAGATFALPDGRAWELVTPSEMNGAEVANFESLNGGIMQAAENGDAITYFTTLPIGADQLSSPSVPQALSKRGPDGWSTQDISPLHNEAIATEIELEHGPLPGGETLGGEFSAFSPDLSLAYLSPSHWSTSLAPSVPVPPYSYDNNKEGYVRDNNTGTYTFTKLSVQEWYAEQVALEQGMPSCKASASPAKGEGIDAVSQDGCYVYFNSESILAPGATGKDPLYVAHEEDGKWTTMFIASLSSAEGTGAAPWSGQYLELSPNGRYLAFMSAESLTGYDNHDAISGEMDEEVYLYDAVTNHLVCASCNPTGARPMGQFDSSSGNTITGVADEVLVDPTTWLAGRWLAGVLPRRWNIGQNLGPEREDPRQPRYLTDSGTVFFDSSDMLVPQSVNGLENVYEYEPEGVNNCQGRKGCVSLLSSGTSNQESALIEATPSGTDVFFLTASRLVSQDRSNGYKMYDTHVCSSSVPCSSMAVVIPPCDTGDSCKPAPSLQPSIYGATPSATFSGAGNVVPLASKPAVKKKPTKCTKGKKLIRGRCIKKAKAQRKSAKGRK